MVLSAPLFLLAQTRAFGAYYAANREPILRLGLLSATLWMALRALSKSYEAGACADAADAATRRLLAVTAALEDGARVDAAAAAAGYAPRGAAAGAALGRALAGAAAGAAAAAAAPGAAHAAAPLLPLPGTARAGAARARVAEGASELSRVAVGDSSSKIV